MPPRTPAPKRNPNPPKPLAEFCALADGSLHFPDFLEVQKLPNGRAFVRWQRGLQSFVRTVDLSQVGATVQTILEQGVSPSEERRKPE